MDPKDPSKENEMTSKIRVTQCEECGQYSRGVIPVTAPATVTEILAQLDARDALHAQVRRDRIAVASAAKRVDRLLGSVLDATRAPRVEIYDVLAHASAIVTRQLVTVKRRLAQAVALGVDVDADERGLLLDSLEWQLRALEADACEIATALAERFSP